MEDQLAGKEQQSETDVSVKPRSGVTKTRPPEKRRMHRAELSGAHTHVTSDGISVHIYVRDERYLARGRYRGYPFGVTLGTDKQRAEATLRRLLTEIEDGRFCRPSERSSHIFRPPRVRTLTLRELCDNCLREKRKLRGQNTTQTYQGRLSHVLDYAERPDVARRYALAHDVDRAFAIGLGTFLIQRRVSRNGRGAGQTRPMSGREVRNVLETLRMVLTWGARADVRQLPVEFANPITSEIVGRQPVKDPLRAVPLPLEERLKILDRLDDWQFLNLSILLVLPIRPEDAARALITDVVFEEGALRLGTHFGGGDVNKGKVDVTMPLPIELIELFQLCVRQRTEGPLFVSRNAGRRRRRISQTPGSRDELQTLFADKLANCPSGQIQAPQDQKKVFCELLRELGGLTTNQIGKEMQKLLPADRSARVYDLRHGVTQDMHDAGIRQLELRYLTSHTTADILNEYVRLDPRGEMQKYYERCRPLLERIGERARRMASARRWVA
jgi:hypothetical protein